PLLPAQVAFLLLRISAHPRFLFLCRTLAPALSLSTFGIFDEMVLQCAGGILRLDFNSLPQAAITQLRLPLRSGGFGLRALVHIAPAAFLGSLAAAAPLLLLPPPPATLYGIHHAMTFLAPLRLHSFPPGPSHVSGTPACAHRPLIGSYCHPTP